MTNIRFKNFNIEAYKPGKSGIKKIRKVIKLSAELSLFRSIDLPDKLINQFFISCSLKIEFISLRYSGDILSSI